MIKKVIMTKTMIMIIMLTIMTKAPTNFSERCQLLPASDQTARAGDAVALAGHLHVGDHRPAPGLVVVEVHQLPAGKRRDRSSRSLRASRLLLRFALADVDEVLSKFVSILHVVTT